MEMQNKKERKRQKNDLLLLGAVAVLAVFYFLWKVLMPETPGAEVVVQVHGKEYARLPLSKNQELDIAYGDAHNQLVIRDGKATVTEANCPDGLCIHQADISKNGEMIVCLPNQVLISIENGEESELDGMVK